MIKRRILVIADDLTSAAEVAGWIASADGTVIQLATGLGPVLRSGNYGCVVTGSRALTAVDAQELVRDVVREQLPADIDRRGLMVIKTMDSSLRGNWAAELRALMDELHVTTAVVAPAFPAYARVTRGGVQFVDGQPVHLGPAGTDPITPVTDSALRSHVTKAGLAAVEVGRPNVDNGRILSDALLGSYPGPTAIIVDAETDVDLELIAGLATASPFILWSVGPGLASALVAKAGQEPAPLTPSESVLAVVGSLHPATRRQVDHAKSQGVPVIELGDPADNIVELLSRALLQQGRAILCSPESPISNPNSALAAAAAAVLDQVPSTALILTGGDTALAVAEALGSTTLSIHGEWAPGIPFGRMTGRHHTRVVTKAGGFGAPNTLVHIMDAMSGLKVPSGTAKRRSKR